MSGRMKAALLCVMAVALLATGAAAHWGKAAPLLPAGTLSGTADASRCGRHPVHTASTSILGFRAGMYRPTVLRLSTPSARSTLP